MKNPRFGGGKLERRTIFYIITEMIFSSVELSSNVVLKKS